MDRAAKASQRARNGDRTHRPEVNLGELGGFIGFYLRLAQTISFQAFVKEAGETGRTLRAGYFAVLTLIGENPGITQTALSRANGRDKSSLTPVIDELERRGFLTRHRVESNRRAYSLQLTPSGEDARRRLLKAALIHEERLGSMLTTEEQQELLRMLQLLTQQMGSRFSD
jgi:DNA-binding MarR family transcriptional regulator